MMTGFTGDINVIDDQHKRIVIRPDKTWYFYYTTYNALAHLVYLILHGNRFLALVLLLRFLIFKKMDVKLIQQQYKKDRL